VCLSSDDSGIVGNDQILKEHILKSQPTTQLRPGTKALDSQKSALQSFYVANWVES